MKINKLLKLSFQNLRRNKRKNSILFVPLTIILVLLFITSIIQYSVDKYLDKLGQSLELRKISGIEYLPSRYDEIKKEIEQIDHVEWVYNQEVTLVYTSFLCEEFINGEANGSIRFYPITNKVYPELLAGRPIYEGEEYVALIPSKIYASSYFRDIQNLIRDDEYLNGLDFLGQELTFKDDDENLEYTFTVVGVYDSDKNNNYKDIYIPEETVRKINQNVSYKPEDYSLTVVVDNLKNIKYVEQQMTEKNLMNKSAIVQQLDQYVDSSTEKGNISDATSINSDTQEVIRYVTLGLLIMVSIILIIMLLVTNYNKSYLSTTEIGLKKIEGYTNKDIQKIAIIENILLCFISVIIALIITFIIVQLFNVIVTMYIAKDSVGITTNRVKEQLYYIQKIDKKISPIHIIVITCAIIIIESINTFLINRRILSKNIANILKGNV